MFLSIIIYIIFVLLIWWAYSGYLWLIHLLALFYKENGEDTVIPDDADLPTMTILVPCYNEEAIVLQKVNNIRALKYPRNKLEVYFLDGTSTDNTVKRLREKIRDLDYIKVVPTKTSGKINQMNYYLPRVKSDVVVCTDMDALMKTDVLKKFAAKFNANPDVNLLGACVYPLNCNDLEKQFWQTQNWFRIIESRVVSTSIVVAPCYAFRREHLNQFPDDCIADDIYVSFLANTTGKRGIYMEDAIAYETRAPQSVEQMVTHKFRKANAYIIELLRFCYHLPRMDNKWKVIYLTKVLQLILAPWILIFFLIGSVSLLFNGPGSVNLVIFSFAFLAGTLFITHLLVRDRVKLVANNRFKKRSNLAIFLITNLVLCLASITYPFYSQTSNYKKTGKKVDE